MARSSSTAPPCARPSTSTESTRQRLEDLHAVARAVVGVEAAVAGEGVALALVDLEPGRDQSAGDGIEVLDHERRVGLASRRERLLDADVDLRADRAPHVVLTEPRTATSPQCRRLVDLGQAEPVRVEPTGGVLAAGRARDLHVVQRDPEIWATTKMRRNGRTTPPCRSGYDARSRRLNASSNTGRRSSGSAWSVG